MKKSTESVLLTIAALTLLLVLFSGTDLHGSLNEKIVTPPPQGNKTSTQMAMENIDTVAKANQDNDEVEPGDAVPIPTAEEREDMVNRLIYGTSFDPTASSSSDHDIVLLSQRYNDDRLYLVLSANTK